MDLGEIGGGAGITGSNIICMYEILKELIKYHILEHEYKVFYLYLYKYLVPGPI